LPFFHFPSRGTRQDENHHYHSEQVRVKKGRKKKSLLDYRIIINLRAKQNISRHERTKPGNLSWQAPNLGFGLLLRRRQGMRKTRAGAYSNHCGQRMKSPLLLGTPCYTTQNKTLRRRDRNEAPERRAPAPGQADRRRVEGTKGWMLTCCCCCCGGAGWSGGSESDEIRWRRRVGGVG